MAAVLFAAIVIYMKTNLLYKYKKMTETRCLLIEIHYSEGYDT